MSFRASLQRLAQHARQPLIRFPDRSAKRELLLFTANSTSARLNRPNTRAHGQWEEPGRSTLPAEARNGPHAHTATAHPCAPQSTVDAFSRFQHSQQNPRTDFSQSSSYGGPATPPTGSGSGSVGAASSGGKGGVLSVEDELPEWLRRGRLPPVEDEIEAVMSGGATISTPVTKDYQLKWHIAQI
ncbi:hypothetical protein JCM8097_009143 [Rhodosporidiobolus ruineniae]